MSLILDVKIETVQGKLVPLEWTETLGGLLEWWHDPEVPLVFPVERASSCYATGRREIFPDDAVKVSLIMCYEVETGLLFM